MYTIYTQNGCNFCLAAKMLLDNHGYSYKEINISEDETAKSFLRGNGYKTVPQIFINSKHIGGYDELNNIINANKLNEFIK